MRGDEGVHRGTAITSGPPNFQEPVPLHRPPPKPVAKQKPAAVKEPKRIFVFEVFDQGSQTKAIESNIVQRAAQLAMQDFRSSVGLKTEGQIKGDGGQILGRWSYQAAAAA